MFLLTNKIIQKKYLTESFVHNAKWNMKSEYLTNW